VAAALLVVVAVGCGSVKYRPLRAGECLPASSDVVGLREQDPARVPCSATHRYEVYATESLSLGPDWPGQGPVDEAAKQACYSAFAGAVGVDPADLGPGIDVVHIAPSEQSWNTAGDRAVECLVRIPEQAGRFVHGTAVTGT